MYINAIFALTVEATAPIQGSRQPLIESDQESHANAEPKRCAAFEEIADAAASSSLSTPSSDWTKSHVGQRQD
jgi:hypothetical protein